ncbi:MAG: hypothetical protein KDA89_15245, partial [Planctomycetaceae bacterium]|nr:hypothetical protein [Planctomycetaceae bacterium]
MPLSTFSSERVPQGYWGRTWLVAVLLSLSTVAVAEQYLRTQGHVPVINDGAELWSWYRNEVYGDPERTVVLVGRSRQLGGFWTDGFREQFPDHKLVQLSVAGAKTLPVFRDLADDEDFCGTMICSVMEFDLEKPDAEGHPYLDEYIRKNRREESSFAHWEFGFRHCLNRLVSLNARTSLRSCWRDLFVNGTMPAAVIDQCRYDRCKYYDFTGADPEKLSKARLQHNKPGKTHDASR